MLADDLPRMFRGGGYRGALTLRLMEEVAWQGVDNVPFLEGKYRGVGTFR